MVEEIYYSEKLIDHFRNPRNLGMIENPDAEATKGSPVCGDMVTFQIKVKKVGDKEVIEDIKFMSYGCASNIATASVLTELVKGKSIDDAEKITWKDISDALGGLPNIKVHCSVLAMDTFKEVLKVYRNKDKISETSKNIDEFDIYDALADIVHPEKGKLFRELNLIKTIDKEKGVWKISFRISKFEKFYNNLVEEIKEHLEGDLGLKSKDYKLIFED